MRLRAPFLALVALWSVAPLADAASIRVTTFGESGLGDGLCSLREAVAASGRAAQLNARENNRNRIEDYQEDIADPENIERLQFPNQYYPRGTVLLILELLKEELETHDPLEAPLLADVIDQIDDIEALPDEKVYLADIEETIALIERALVANQAEIDRLEAANVADGCADGTSFDTVILPEGTYTLDAVSGGEVSIGVNVTLSGTGDGSVVTTSGASRLFSVAEGYTVEFKSLRMSGGNAGAGDGGAIRVFGTANLSRVTFEGNTALNGGAVHVEQNGSLNVETGRFTGNSAAQSGGAVASVGGSVSLVDVKFGQSGGMGNTAVTTGGAVSFTPVNIGGSLKIERASLVDNQAVSGAALHVFGTDSAVTITNATFGQNRATVAATIDIDADGGTLAINNVTLVDNTAAGGTAGLRVTDINVVTVYNSLLAGNAGTLGAAGNDCDFTAVTVNDADFQYNYYAIGATGCPGLRYHHLTAPENTNFELPSGQTVWTWLLKPLDVELGAYLPLYPVDVLSVTENRLVNRGAGSQQQASCAAVDQRNQERASFVDADCDIGAVEYQVGRRKDDRVTILVGEASCLDVFANDIGDATYTRYSLEVLRVEREGAVALVASTDPAGYLTQWEARRLPATPPRPTVVDLNDPGLPQSCRDLAAAGVQETILFTPAAGFRGETNVTYVAGWQTDAVATGTTVRGTLSGVTRVATESAGGITSSSIGGAAGPWWLCVLALLGLRRVARVFSPVWGAVVLLSLAGLPARAVDNVIYVNSGDDPVNEAGIPVELPGDGRCTLREALSTARNDQANLTLGDCLDGNEGPDIIEFTRDDNGVPVSVVSLNGTLEAWGGVTIRCPEDVAFTCTIQPSTTATTTFPLINSRGSIALQRMVLEGGNAGIANDGGAINSIGGVSVVDSLFRNNRARAGGAIYLLGQTSNLVVTNSTFEGNVSTGVNDAGGGAVAMSASGRHVVRVSGSTFTGNQSAALAAAMMVTTASEVVIVNSTFSGNSSTAGSGALDLSGAAGGATLRNITVVDNQSGVDVLSGLQRNAIEFSSGTGSTILASSIVAANYDASGLLDANCGAGNLGATYNLFGELLANATCPIGLGGAANLFALASDVYDGTNAAYLTPLGANGGDTRTHGFNDPQALDVLGLIVDRGNPATLVDALTRGSNACATVDQRGGSRESGGRCDQGAFEYIQVSAVAEAASNNGRRDRQVMVDVLANDVFDDLDPIKLDCTQLDLSAAPAVRFSDALGSPCIAVYPATPTDTIGFLRKDDLDDLRIILGLTADQQLTVSRVPASYLNGKFPEDFVPGWSGTAADAERLARESPVTPAMLLPGFVVRYQTAGSLLASSDTTGGPRKFDYEIYTVGGLSSDPATVEVSVLNVPPMARNDEIVVGVGQTAVFNLLANDEDYDAVITTTGGLDPSTLVINGCDGLVGSPGTYDCEFGRLVIDFTTGEGRWTPFNTFNPFSDAFSYSVKDRNGCVAVTATDPGYAAYQECLSLRRESTASVRILSNRPQANGGAILGDDDLGDMLGIDFLGGTGLYFLGPLLLAIGRRRRRG